MVLLTKFVATISEGVVVVALRGGGRAQMMLLSVVPLRAKHLQAEAAARLLSMPPTGYSGQMHCSGEAVWCWTSLVSHFQVAV